MQLVNSCYQFAFKSLHVCLKTASFCIPPYADKTTTVEILEDKEL